ncbi:MAG: hypothetical protein SGARI_001091, partial [Bacillariaceae sp.]
MFNSMGSALTSIRSRLHGVVMGGAGGGEDKALQVESPEVPSSTPQQRQRLQSSEDANAALLTSSLSRRLSTAERAHSTRMPLGLLQLQQQSERALLDDVVVDNESGGGAPSTSTSAAQPPVAAQAMARSRSLSTATATDGSSSGDGETRAKRRRSSVLLASRRHAEVHEQMDQELHEGVHVSASIVASTSGLLPQTIPEADDEEAKSSEFMTTHGKQDEENPSDYHDKLDESLSEEIELLLPESTREQLDQAERRASLSSMKGNQYAYHDMAGSLR